jgi:hypothetical protein
MKQREIQCEYQPYISRPPVHDTRSLYTKAASNDRATIDAYGQKWVDQIRRNHKTHGPFKNKSIGNLFGKYLHRPVICAGSGPSLKYNVDKLNDRGEIPLVSCLHNFQYFMDRGVKADYWVSLDAGLIVVEEVSEGGAKSADEYWAMTKDQTLLAYVGSHPELLARWQGEIYFYNSPVPEAELRDAIAEVEVFNNWVSSGGNVLGAACYIARAYFGCGTTIFVGADFSFGYDRKFHSWDSKYDHTMGNYNFTVDIFGNKVATWPSYNNFKSFFDYVCTEISGQYINCTEGGTLGAYPEGNLMTIKQMDLEQCFKMFNMHESIREAALNPEVGGDVGRMLLY